VKALILIPKDTPIGSKQEVAEQLANVLSGCPQSKRAELLEAIVVTAVSKTKRIDEIAQEYLEAGVLK